MSQRFESLNELGCVEELESRLAKIEGILATLEAAMENQNSFITIQPIAKYSVTAAMDMAEECKEINNRIYKLLPREM
ncbi:MULTISPECIES: hypothetical protein [Vibrio]|uniref:hypothetical protein n=1 Tax=Vibrio TaxID=662 RepID=UPI00237C98A7|nr:hypothetical protein [Vibrio aestuarianus]MDE1333334.1 hypothetical protein [Vibrio aestuarianus]